MSIGLAWFRGLDSSKLALSFQLSAVSFRLSVIPERIVRQPGGFSKKVLTCAPRLL
jgi:hypothetical protein